MGAGGKEEYYRKVINCLEAGGLKTRQKETKTDKRKPVFTDLYSGACFFVML